MSDTITLPRAVVQQASEALEEHGGAYMHHEAEYRKACAALRAAPEQCSCGDRAKDQCPGEWEPGCDLGNNPKYARRVPLKQEPVAWNSVGATSLEFETECSDGTRGARTMTEQTHALWLADDLEAWTLGKPTHHREAAAELRRLHATNQELLEALKRIDKEFRKYGRQHWPEAEKARSAIAKATGKPA